MSTPWKDAEDAFWTWLATAARLPTDLKIYKSHEGKGLPFFETPELFKNPAAMPAAWLNLTKPEPEIQGAGSVLDYTNYTGGLAYNVPPDATSRDTFEALVTDIRNAILGSMTAGVDEIDVHELTDESVRVIVPPGKFAPVLGYVWEFRLRFGYTAHHTP